MRHLRDVAPEDTFEYVAHRLRLAGCDKDTFDADALALLPSRTKLKRVDRELELTLACVSSRRAAPTMI